MKNSNNEIKSNQNDKFETLDTELNNIELAENIDSNQDEETNDTKLPPSSDSSISIDDNTSNCLALTIKEEYKLSLKTKRIIHSLKMSFKVFISYVTLSIIKFFL